MKLGRILQGLERCDATGTQAARMARLGFLNWACAAEGPVTAEMARAALDCPATQGARSAAARAFVDMLRQAGRGGTVPPARSRRARLLH